MKIEYAVIAQLVVRFTCNEDVGGSSLSDGSMQRGCWLPLLFITGLRGFNPYLCYFLERRVSYHDADDKAKTNAERPKNK